MADKKNTEVLPASEPPAPVQEAPVVVREKRGWFRPLISALVVVAALVIGGFGGFAIARAPAPATGPSFEQGQFPGAPGQQQGQQGGPGQGTQQNGDRPQPPSDRSGDSDDSDTDG